MSNRTPVSNAEARRRATYEKQRESRGEGTLRDRYNIYLAAVDNVPGIVTKSYEEWIGN
mgnify:CR=1 FL=1|jgi:hypothetical protein